MGLRFSRSAALLVGLLLPVIETWRRWRMLSNWPLWLDDYIAGGLLLFAWHAGRSHPGRGRPYLMAAWGYTFGLAYASFFGQLSWDGAADPSGLARGAVLGFKGFGLVLSLVCLGLAWVGEDWREKKTAVRTGDGPTLATK